ncbi:MAG: methylthioribulose 1-phosphate dehydratase [Gammaproteobacteria bacterium]|nr:methylthioribulose 1-phosphate dehydratase [Gammaproteobacteria bacterium]
MSAKQFTPTAFPEKAQALVEVCHFLGARDWAPATGGNFSVRLDKAHCLITQSGRDKTKLNTDDLMVCNLSGRALDPALRPSAELALHTCLYQLDASIGAVLHTHSVTSTVLSRATEGDLHLQGFEMQKALAGNLTHEDEISIAIFDNDQDMTALAECVQQRWAQNSITQPGLLVRGHGLYAWGTDLAEARRHVEGLEFLFACAWQEKLREHK